MTCWYRRDRLARNNLLAVLRNCATKIVVAIGLMIIRCKIYFVFFIFVVCTNHENIFTTKISRSTVVSPPLVLVNRMSNQRLSCCGVGGSGLGVVCRNVCLVSA